MQIGIKEIWTKDWNKFLEIFPDSKIIVTARDPRDLYISVYYWRNRKSNTQNKYLSNRRKKLIENQMRSQIKLIENMSCYKLKYEHLCKNPDVIVNEIKDYVNSPIPDIGDIGKYLESLSKRKNEYRKHKNEITTKSIEKWKTEKDKKLVENCNEFFDSIPWYCDFWDYRRKKNG